MELTLVNGRYEGRLADGRLLCVLPDVFEMNRGQFPETELYNPQEWLSSVDGENCWIEEWGPLCQQCRRNDLPLNAELGLCVRCAIDTEEKGHGR